MKRREYYAESIACCLDEMGIPDALTPAQMLGLAEGIETSIDMEGEAFGTINIPNPLQAEMENRDARHKKNAADMEKEWEEKARDYKSTIHDLRDTIWKLRTELDQARAA